MVEVSDIKTLTTQGFLVPCKVFAPTIPDLKGVATVRGDYDVKELDTKYFTFGSVGFGDSWWCYFNQIIRKENDDEQSDN